MAPAPMTVTTTEVGASDARVPVSMWLLVVTLHVAGMRGTLASILTLACSKMCTHGTCRYPAVGLKSFVRCDCHPGWGGEGCSIPCDKPCMHGQCVVLSDRPVCVCRLGFSGHDCSQPGYDVGNLLTLARLATSVPPMLLVANSNNSPTGGATSTLTPETSLLGSPASKARIQEFNPVNSAHEDADIRSLNITNVVTSNADSVHYLNRNNSVQNLLPQHSAYLTTTTANPALPVASRPDNVSSPDSQNANLNHTKISLLNILRPTGGVQTTTPSTLSPDLPITGGFLVDQVTDVSVNLTVSGSSLSVSADRGQLAIDKSVAGLDSSQPATDSLRVVQDAATDPQLQTPAGRQHRMATEATQFLTDNSQAGTDSEQLAFNTATDRAREVATDREESVTDGEQVASGRRAVTLERRRIRVPLEDNPNQHMELNVESGASQCSPNFICRNGGRCVKGTFGGFRCQCSPPFTGTFCQSACPKTCYNGGWCLRLRHPLPSSSGSRMRSLPRYTYSYGCGCPPGYGGSQCERVVE